MFSFFKKKVVIPHVRLTGIIGSAGKFKQGMDLAGQREILKKAFIVEIIESIKDDMLKNYSNELIESLLS